MKCLLCSSKFQDQKGLIDHYLSYHNVDANNWFFRKLFQTKNKAFLKNCVRCNEFITTDRHKRVHDFLMYMMKERVFLLKKNRLILQDTLDLKFTLLNLRNTVVFIIFMILKNALMIS